MIGFRSVLSRMFMTGVAMAAVLSFALASEAQTQSAEALLKRDLKAGTKLLQKDIRIYHYFNLEKVWDELKTPEGRVAFINRYMYEVTGRFWNLNYHAASYINAGPGVYLAIDPHRSSIEFGNSAIEMQIPAGTKLINVVAAIPVKKDTLQALVTERIINQSDIPELFPGKARGFYRDTLKNMTQTKHERFRTFVQGIFESEGITLIEYNWNTDLPGFCRQHNYSSFVYIGSRHPQNPQASMVDERYLGLPIVSKLDFPMLTPHEAEVSARVVKFRNVLAEIVALRKRGQKVPASLPLKYYTPEELAETKRMIHSCVP